MILSFLSGSNYFNWIKCFKHNGRPKLLTFESVFWSLDYKYQEHVKISLQVFRTKKMILMLSVNLFKVVVMVRLMVSTQHIS